METRMVADYYFQVQAGFRRTMPTPSVAEGREQCCHLFEDGHQCKWIGEWGVYSNEQSLEPTYLCTPHLLTRGLFDHERAICPYCNRDLVQGHSLECLSELA